MKFIFALITIVSLTGCASNSGVVALGPDTYMVSRQAATGFTGLGTLRADAMREAGEFCIKSNKTVRVNNTTESKPPYIFGNFPRAEVEFMCLDPNDPDLTRPKMKTNN